MKRIFLFNETLVPIADYDFRVTVVALQSVRGLVLERKGWPHHLPSDHKILARFLDLPISPLFLPSDEPFEAYEAKYQYRIKELTGFPSSPKHFRPEGKTFREFAEHRLGTTVEGALFHAIVDLHRAKRINIPSLGADLPTHELLQQGVTESDRAGLVEALNFITNPLLETKSKIVQMNPALEKEFPAITLLGEKTVVGRTFGDIVTDATVQPIVTAASVH